MTYLIIDTEGKDYLYEIAIIDPTANSSTKPSPKDTPKPTISALNSNP